MAHYKRIYSMRRPMHVLAEYLHHHPLKVLTVLSLGALLGCGLLLFLVERAHGGVSSFWDALWLSGVALTTSEPYGLKIVTPLGRTLAVLTAFAGITLSGSFVAALTGVILRLPEPDYEREEFREICARLERLEESIARLVAQGGEARP